MFARFTTLVGLTLALLAPSSAPLPVLAALPRMPDPLALTLATERVIIFKDGYGLFVKSARGIADAEGKVHTDQVPGAAVLGTFWAIPEGRPLKSTIADWHETVRAKTDEGSCLSTIELLRANEGKQVIFGLGDKELQGKLLDVLEAPALRTKIQPGAEGTSETELAPRGGELVAIEVPDKGRLVMPVSQVRTLAGKELITHCLRPVEVATRSKRLTFDFGPEAAGKVVSLKLLYFTPGGRWCRCGATAFPSATCTRLTSATGAALPVTARRSSSRRTCASRSRRQARSRRSATAEPSPSMSRTA